MQTVGNVAREGSGAVLTTGRTFSVGVEYAVWSDDVLRVSCEQSSYAKPSPGVSETDLTRKNMFAR